MEVLRKFIKEKHVPELKKLTVGTKFSTYYEKRKMFFDDVLKNKILPKSEVIDLVESILESEDDSMVDNKLKRVAFFFKKENQELFSNTGDKSLQNSEKNSEKNRVQNSEINVEESNAGDKSLKLSPENEDIVMLEENQPENETNDKIEDTMSNAGAKALEKIEEIKQDVKEIEQLKEHPDKKHIEEFNAKLSELRENIERKFNDMIDSHMDLKKSIDEKRIINNNDAKSRIENLEAKIEMLYGNQMGEAMKPKKQPYTPKVKSKDDVIREYLGKKMY